MNNRYGLDASYFSNKMSRIIRDIGSYKPDEFARECARMSRTAEESVMREPEFQSQPAAHLTIPGALEWDGDNGTHGADGESRGHGESRVAVRDAIAETLGDAYDCTRVWSAWGVGTMSQDDFSLICDDESRLEELTEAAIQAYDGAEVNRLRALLECSQGDMRQADQIMARQRVELDNLEQSRRSFFDLSQDLEKRLGKAAAFVQSLCDAAGSQPSVATGYLRDILDVLSASVEPASPAEEDPFAATEAPYVPLSAAEVEAFMSMGDGNKAKPESFPCWSCQAPVTMANRADADGNCPHCEAELDLEDWPNSKTGCAYEVGDWACREGGYLWYAGDGEGWDPEDCTHICPHCRTKDYLEAAKEEAESCSSYSNNGSSGTGLDIWTSSEKAALTANHPAACKALAEIGPVSALDGDDVVICNAQQVAP